MGDSKINDKQDYEDLISALYILTSSIFKMSEVVSKQRADLEATFGFTLPGRDEQIAMHSHLGNCLSKLDRLGKKLGVIDDAKIG